MIILMIIFVRDRTARCRRPLRRGACRKNAECGTWFNSECGMRNAELFFGKGSAYIKHFRYICSGGACRLPKTWAKFSLLKKLGALNQKRASSRKQYTLRKKCARSSGNRKGRPYGFKHYYHQYYQFPKNIQLFCNHGKNGLNSGFLHNYKNFLIL